MSTELSLPQKPLDFSYAYGAPQSSAVFRQENADFIVDEKLGFEFSGEGEHLVFHIQKEGENTHWVAEKLANFFGVKTVDVGYCGKKDRHAITSQWFSVYLPTQTEMPDCRALLADPELTIQINQLTRHHKKLRPGDHSANTFTLRLRDIAYAQPQENQTDLEARMAKIAECGVPNYFGEQRFGRGGNNLVMAQTWIDSGKRIKNRNQRGMVLSAARSYVFNCVLSARVAQQNWCELIEGDVAEGQFPTGPLWGRGRSATSGLAGEFEQEGVAALRSWCDQLEHVGLAQERREFVLRPSDFHYEFIGTDLVLRFSLAPGQYATSVLREICQLEGVARG